MEYASMDLELDTSVLVMGDMRMAAAFEAKCGRIHDEVMSRGLHMSTSRSLDNPDLMVMTVYGPEAELIQIRETLKAEQSTKARGEGDATDLPVVREEASRAGRGTDD